MIEGNVFLLEKRKQCKFGVAEILWRREKNFLSHSKNIMFKRKAREALYRTVGMTQQATEWQPVWATCCSGKTATFSPVPSGNQALKLS